MLDRHMTYVTLIYVSLVSSDSMMGVAVGVVRNVAMGMVASCVFCCERLSSITHTL